MSAVNVLLDVTKNIPRLVMGISPFQNLRAQDHGDICPFSFGHGQDFSPIMHFIFGILHRHAGIRILMGGKIRLDHSLYHLVYPNKMKIEFVYIEWEIKIIFIFREF